MSYISNEFFKAIQTMGMKEIKQPIFYNTPIGIRFEIGGSENVYLEDVSLEDVSLDKNIVNPSYIFSALNRARALYASLPCQFNILRIDSVLDGESVQEKIRSICFAADLPLPHEQNLKNILFYDGKEVHQIQLYWDIAKIPFNSDKLLSEIIKSDIGGYSEFTSNVFLVNTQNCILFHLYDDRGADLVAASKEVLRPIYDKFNNWILDYDREKIDATFAD